MQGHLRAFKFSTNPINYVLFEQNVIPMTMYEIFCKKIDTTGRSYYLLTKTDKHRQKPTNTVNNRQEADKNRQEADKMKLKLF